jgi:Ca-activated chloride channel family protein
MTGLPMALPMVLMSDEEVAAYGRSPEAGFGAIQTARGVLPLTAMEIDARVAGVVATIEVAQTFVNTSGAAIEATYIFPLPDRAAVHRFRMVIGDRVIDGVIDERGAARERYDHAIAAGHRAAITEEDRAGVFTLRVGNLMPGDVATVRLSLVGPLPVDDGEVTFRFPLVVAPRYMPGTALGGEQAGLGSAFDTDRVPDASRISPPVRLPGWPNPVRLGIRVALTDGVMRDVVSSLHAVVETKRDAQVIEVRPGERLDRDFILRWRITGAELASSLVCADDPGGAAGTFALTLVPPSTPARAARPRDVVFVIDRSGSMGGWKMVAARRAAARMIDTLTSRDRFAAIAFDDQVELLPATGLVAGSDRHRFQAVEALAKLDSRGGTEMSRPLQAAVRMLGAGGAARERVIVLVTDGQVGNEDHILHELAPQLRDIKMFTLGIDQAVNAAFLRRLAAAGGGLCELVESEDRLDEVMAKVHRRIGTPIATELAVHARGFDLERSWLAPAKLPDVYAGAPVVILGRYRGTAPAGAAIDIEGTTLGDPLRMTVVVAASAAGADAAVAPTWLAASWARARIRDLEDSYAVSRTGELEQLIVRTSQQYSVLSRFTAFLAIDASQVVNPGGGLQQVVQPVEPAAGWNAPRMPGGAAPSGGGIGAAPRVTMLGPSALAGAASRPLGGSRPVAPTPGSSPPARMSPSAFAPPVANSVSAPIAKQKPMRVEEHGGAAGLVDYDDVDDAPSFEEPERSANAPAIVVTEASVDNVYLTQLVRLAIELGQHVAAGDTVAIRLVRQRLFQWVEDVRSVGLGQLVRTVEQLATRLTAALAAPATLASEAAAIADELAALATTRPQPAASRSRSAFWK